MNGGVSYLSVFDPSLFRRRQVVNISTDTEFLGIFDAAGKPVASQLVRPYRYVEVRRFDVGSKY